MKSVLFLLIVSLAPFCLFAQNGTYSDLCYEELVELTQAYRNESEANSPDKEYLEWLTGQIRAKLVCAGPVDKNESAYRRSLVPIVIQVAVLATATVALYKTAKSAVRAIFKAARSPFTEEVRLAEQQAYRITAQLEAKKKRAKQLERLIEKKNGEVNAKMQRQIAALQESVSKLEQKVSVLEAKEDKATTLNLNASCSSNFGPSVITQNGSSVTILIKMDGGSANLSLVLREKTLTGSYTNTFGSRGSISLEVSRKSITGSYADSDDAADRGGLVFKRCSRR